MTPQQVIESFWREKAEAAAKSNVLLAPLHAKYFGEPLLGHARDYLKKAKVDESVEETTQHAGSAVVIAREPLAAGHVQRKRYHLSADGESWRITSIESECIHCAGTGRSGRMSCHMCGGSGWYDFRKNAA